MKLKRATKADIPALLSIEQSIAGEKTYSALLTEEEWIASLSKELVYLIENDGRVAGSIMYEMKSPVHAYISGLAVMPEFQGQGIAREAMELVLKEIGPIERIDLVTHPENIKAVNLYTSLGFTVESRTENYFGDGEPRITLALIKNRDQKELK